MNWVDAAIVTALLIGLWCGSGRGLGQAGFQVGGVMGGIVAAYVWSEPLSVVFVQRFLLPAWLARPLAVVVLAVGCAVAGQGAGRLWNRWVRASALATWDRWAGALLGLGIAAFISGSLLLIWIEWPGRSFPAAVEGSFLARYLLGALPSIYRKLDWVLAPLR